MTLEKIPGQLEASYLIFLTLGSVKQSNKQVVFAHKWDREVDHELGRQRSGQFFGSEAFNLMPTSR